MKGLFISIPPSGFGKLVEERPSWIHKYINRMHIRGRALYNLLCLSQKRGEGEVIYPWQIECYRSCQNETLMKRIREHNIEIDMPTFMRLGAECDSPEMLLGHIVGQGLNIQEKEQVYLLVFELWRRYLPNKRSFSIFCDQLDYLMQGYDQGLDVGEELFIDFENLGQIMEELSNSHDSPSRVMEYVCSYLAHDLENFLYDYILDLMGKGNDEEAAVLTFLFKKFVQNQKWFDFLRLQQLVKIDVFDTETMVCRFVDEIVENQDVHLSMDVLAYVSKRGDRFLLEKLAPKVVSMELGKQERERLLNFLQKKGLKV